MDILTSASFLKNIITGLQFLDWQVLFELQVITHFSAISETFLYKFFSYIKKNFWSQDDKFCWRSLMFTYYRGKFYGETEVTYNTDTESEDRLNKVLEEVERIILDLPVYTSSSLTGGRMRRDTDRDWSVFWVVFYFVLLLVSNFNIYRYILFFQVLLIYLMLSCSVLSNSLGPHEPTRILCPWNFSGKNARVGCHFLLQRIFPYQGSNHVSCISCIGKQILYH